MNGIELTLAEYFQAPRSGLNPLLYNGLIEAELRDDIGRGGDLTTEALLPAEAVSTVVLNARDNGVLAGLDAALYAFWLLDPAMTATIFVQDGQPVSKGTDLVALRGRTRALLTAERTALNILGHLSGIASATNRLVNLVQHTSAQIVDTRKTLPGLRALQKYAVRTGGGRNHRFGLDDAVMIKDNHIAAAGGLAAAVQAVRAKIGHTVKVEIEVDTLDQLQQALQLPVDIVLLDNMAPTTLKKAVELTRQAVGTAVKLEASGGLTEGTVRAVAETGVDLLSLGALTHSVKNFDIGLDFKE